MKSGFESHGNTLTVRDIPFLAVIFFLGLLLFLCYTWAMPLIDPDEPRYAATAREMVVNGNWIVPHFNGIPRINKPPLFYWEIALCYKIFGINEISARLPSALAATGTAMITYLLGKRLGDSKKAFWTVLILISSPLFFIISRLCITDMLLTFFVCASLFLFFTGYMDGKKSNLRRLLLYLFLSLAFLVKGPVGILIFIIVTTGFLSWVRDVRYIRRLWYLPGFMLFLGIICMWGVPFWLSLGTEQIFSLLSQEMSGRFIGGYAHSEPFYYYLPVLLIGFFPWFIFVCISFIQAFYRRTSFSVEEKKQIYFFCSWLLFPVLFFSISQSKLMTYILPVSPAIALLTVPVFTGEMGNRVWKRFRWLIWGILGLSVVLPAYLIINISSWTPFKYGIPAFYVIILIIILFGGITVSLCLFIAKRRLYRLQRYLCLTNCLFLIFMIICYMKYVGPTRSTRDIVEKCLENNSSDYTLLSYPKFIPSLVFYTGKFIREAGADTALLKELASHKNNESFYIFMTARDYRERKDWFKENELRVLCRDENYVIIVKSKDTE